MTAPTPHDTISGLSPAGPRSRWSGLFARVFVTFLLTVVVSGAAAGFMAYRLGRAYGPEWFEPIFEQLVEQNDELARLTDDPAALEARLTQLEEELRVNITFHEDRKRMRHRLHELPMGMVRRLRRGQPVVIPPGARHPPVLLVPIRRPGGERPTSLLEVRPRPRHGGPLLLVGLTGLSLLGLGAFALSSFMTARLRRLQASTQRLASGDLSTRAPVREAAVPDEIDDLARAFNHMAGRTEQLVDGQKTLLTNVSHELRTPVARMKVLLEILADRIELVDEAEPDHRAAVIERAFDRVSRGLGELGEDLDEVEKLISDLLTSGRMELGKDGALHLETAALADVLDPLGRKYHADLKVEPPALTATFDRMLIERLVANLLVNARRACPDGALTVLADDTGDAVRVAVEDEGPGVAPGDRERIFEPFARLDQARTRDAGGAGLGLYLCRQIARAHGGTLHVEARRDAAPGARFVLTLPRPA